MGAFLLIVGLVLAVAIVVGVIQANAAAETLKETEQSVRAEFEVDELFVSPVDQAFVGFNFERSQVCLGGRGYRSAYDFSQIAAVEVVKNGTSISTTNRGSQLVGAAIGGVALGGVGLLAGALTGSKNTTDRVRELGVKITVDDHQHPLHLIKLLHWTDKKGLSADSTLVSLAADQAEKINAHLLNGMRRADRAREAAPTVDRIGRIDRLWTLYQAGALSESEYQREKALISSPDS